jgi:hypothetical protein
MIDTIKKLREVEPGRVGKVKSARIRKNVPYRRCTICTAELTPGAGFRTIVTGGGPASFACMACQRKAGDQGWR